MKRIRRTRTQNQNLSSQMRQKVYNPPERRPMSEYDGSDEKAVSTGSTLLDLAISGGRFQEGGIPTGILVEVFGPSGTGKTVMLCQIAGNIQKMGGPILFHDPEARLNKQFATMFGLQSETMDYDNPDTVTEVFNSVREWLPEEKTLHGVFADSLAALSTDLEMGKDEGDKMGMRRAKEFSEEMRKTCRIISSKDVLMVCSNQIRQNSDAGPFGAKYKSPGGEAIGFYSSLRLRCSMTEKIKAKKKVRGKEHQRVIGVKINVEVFKSSVWKPFRTADVYILYDYGIDDIRANLQFIKTTTGDTAYRLGDTKLGDSLAKAIQAVEEQDLEGELKKETIKLWNEIEEKFQEVRKPKE